MEPYGPRDAKIPNAHPVTPLIICLADNIAGQTKEEIDGQISVPQPKCIRLRNREANFLHMDHHHSSRCGSAQSVQHW